MEHNVFLYITGIYEIRPTLKHGFNSKIAFCYKTFGQTFTMMFIVSDFVL